MSVVNDRALAINLLENFLYIQRPIIPPFFCKKASQTWKVKQTYYKVKRLSDGKENVLFKLFCSYLENIW